MNEFISKSSFFTPSLITESAWLQHIPFAFWLTEKINPKIFVELGVHTGVSYFAFCNSVKINEISCLCYGVDTWQGDEHAGFYNNDIFNRVMEHNEANYSGFSHLLKTEFSQALLSFNDNTIDLLHIDGFHTYQAIKKDFESWLPKLSDKGIILFHDINVREKDFGVYQLWAEVKAQYPSFEFMFGKGLGILAVGKNIPPNISFLFSAVTNKVYHNINYNYEKLGLNIIEQYKVLQLIQQLGSVQNLLNIENDKGIVNANVLVENNAFLQNLENENKSLNLLIDDLKKLNAENNLQLNEIKLSLSSTLDKVSKLENEVITILHSAEIKYGYFQIQLQKSHQEKEEQLNILKDEVNRISIAYEELIKVNTWYQNTFEFRSMAGIFKHKIKTTVKNKGIILLDNLLEKEFVKKKYVTAFFLKYIKENGMRNAYFASSQNIKTKGFKTLLNPRKEALIQMNTKLSKPVFNDIVATVPHQNFDELHKELQNFSYLPKISIVVTTYNTKPQLLALAIASIQKQIYQNWELCIVDDGSKNQHVKETLKNYLNNDKFKISFLKKNVGISEASNAAIKLSTGDFIALMDHDDEITPDALFWIVKELNVNNNIDILYTDECKIDEQNNLSGYFYKPDWSPELMINMMYIGHLTVYRKKFLLESVGLFRKEYDFSQDYDLMLRASEKAASIKHISKVLYYWRLTEGSASQGEKPYARISNLAALEDAMKRRGIAADIIELPTANRAKILFDIELVSIVIPTDSKINLTEAINNIITTTRYSHYEIVAVTNSKLISELKRELLDQQNIIFVAYDKPYNFSDKCNEGVDNSNGKIIIIFNDDVRALQDDWIENTIEFLYIEGVGGVSPKLIYENDTIQYAGMASGVRNITGTTFHTYPKDSYEYINFAQLVRNVSILSGACLAIKKSLFLEIGGFDSANTPIAHSDVDISFKLLAKGLRCVYTPYAVLRHYGHLSLSEFKKKNTIIKKDKADIFLLKKWAKYVENDPYFTEPMRSHLYHDSPEYFKIYAPTISIPSKYTKQDILLISHDFSLSGAPIMLLQTCKFLINNGYFVTVMCDQDGPLRDMLLEIGVLVIIDYLLMRQHSSLFKFAKNFDQIICNTVVAWPVVKQMGEHVNTIWWLHEAKVIESFTHISDFVDTLSKAKTVISVSDYSKDYVSKIQPNLLKIRYGYFDIASKVKSQFRTEIKDSKIIFSIIGSVEYRKGHDILINALRYIDKVLLKEIEIWFVGRVLDPDYKNIMMEEINAYDFVVFKGNFSHLETLELIAQSDVIVCPSRDDPFPVVLIEAFCLSKACVVSTHTGQCEIIKDGVNGFIFENENPIHLAEKIEILIRDKLLIGQMGKEARNLYEEYLTIEKFERNMLKLINSETEISIA